MSTDQTNHNPEVLEKYKETFRQYNNMQKDLWYFKNMQSRFDEDTHEYEVFEHCIKEKEKEMNELSKIAQKINKELHPPKT